MSLLSWRRGVRALVLLCTVAALGACASADNRITLRYAPSSGGKACAAAVSVASMLDARGDRMLGHNERFAFRPQGRDVDEWLRRSLMEELAARGCRVVPLDFPGAPSIVAGGTVHAASLVAEGMNHVLDLEFTLVLMDGERVVFKKRYAGRWERVVIMPSRGEIEEMFASALRELLVSAVSDLSAFL